MKLYLHWLRWDLRRFRWPLLAWVLLLAAFGAWLWHLNAHLFDINPRWLKYNEVIASVLGVIEVFILLPLLSSDPAEGTRHFWKTRPPAGYAVAASKLTLAVFFFLVLPLLGWRVVQWAAGFDDNLQMRLGWGSDHIIWTEFLWWTHCVALAALALAAAAANHAGRTVARLLTGFLVLLVPVILAMPFWERDSPAALWVARTTKAVVEGAFTMPGATLWLVIAVIVFLAARRSRTCGRFLRMAHLVVPLAGIGAAAVLPGLESGRKESWQPLAENSEIRKSLKVGQPALGKPLSRAGLANEGLPGVAPARSYDFNLHLAGLPPSYRVSARWRSLKLIAPDGHSIEPAPGHPALYSGSSTFSGLLRVGGATFDAAELERLSLTPCRAEGVLEILVSKEHRQFIPLRPGVALELPGITQRLTEVSRDHPSIRYGLSFSSAISARAAGFTALWVERAAPDRKLPLEHQRDNAWSGYFMQCYRNDSRWVFNYPNSELAVARFHRDMEEGRAAEWRLGASWYEDEGLLEMPVVVNPIVIPRQPGDGRKVIDLVTQMTMPASADDISRQVKVALSLLQISERETPSPLKGDPLVEAVQQFLAQVPRDHIEVLLGIIEEDGPADPLNIRALDYPLRKAIAGLLTAEGIDLPALRQRARLFENLRFELAHRKLITWREADWPNWHEMTDAELLTRWQASCEALTVSTIALERAARRGLPWVPAAIAEVMDCIPGSAASQHIVLFMSPLSDCPAAPDAGIPWLQQNAARLTWNPSTRRWVLP